MEKGSEEAVKGNLKGLIETLVALFEYAWAEQPWRGKQELVCDSGRDLSFDEMVLLLGNLMITYPEVDAASESLVNPNAGVSASQFISEVAHA
jgi:hypothetical protein